MTFNSGNMYSIPEHPAEEEFQEENYLKVSSSVNEVHDGKGTKKYSSSSLPEKPFAFSNKDFTTKAITIPTLVTTEVRDLEITTKNKSFQKDFNRLCVSLTDFSDFGLTTDSKTFGTDKQNTFANAASSYMISGKSSGSYLEVQDCASHSSQEPKYETLLSADFISSSNSNKETNPGDLNAGSQGNRRKASETLVFIDLNEDDDGYQTIKDPNEPAAMRQRSRSMQWIQSTFQNVTNKYRTFLEFRRPSDIAEERMRKSKEELGMEESESETITADQVSPSLGGRRFSENVIGKQRRLPFGLGHLKDFWKDKNPASKRQEEKDIDQTRSDVCPLFNIPRKGDEDELILDALRQAMRKCTAVDPSVRPTSTTVLDQLSKLLND